MAAGQNSALTLFELWDTTARAYLTGFDQQFVNALSIVGNVRDYASDFIYYPSMINEDHIQQVNLPVPLTAPELKLWKGRRHFIKNSTGYITLQKAPYDAGISENIDKVTSADFTGFSIQPEIFAEQISAWPSQNAVALIGGNAQLNTPTQPANLVLAWHGVTNFLATTCYSNPFNTKMTIPGTTTLATYQNYWPSTPLNTTTVQALRADMQARRGFDNRPLGYCSRQGKQKVYLVASPQLAPIAESICLDERLANGATNPIVKYQMEPQTWFDLPPKYWGIICEDRGRPIFIGSKGSPVNETFGLNSAMYEKSREIGFSVVVQLGVGLARQESISIAVTP